LSEGDTTRKSLCTASATTSCRGVPKSTWSGKHAVATFPGTKLRPVEIEKGGRRFSGKRTREHDVSVQNQADENV